MKNFKELSFEEMVVVDGGWLLSSSGNSGFMASFWRGMGIGVGVGATGAACYYGTLSA